MNADRNNKRLDELISKAIGRDKPQFNFNRWKQEHEKEIDIFESQEKSKRTTPATIEPNIWRRILWRKAGYLAAAVLIAGIAFLGGRLSMPHPLPRSMDIEPRVAAEPEGVIVPSDLVAWLDAARLFKRLGMEERMARAFDKAGKLLPYDAVAEINMTEQAITFDSNGEEIFRDQNKSSILAEILGSHESIESLSGIIAQSFRGYYYESKMD